MTTITTTTTSSTSVNGTTTAGNIDVELIGGFNQQFSDLVAKHEMTEEKANAVDTFRHEAVQLVANASGEMSKAGVKDATISVPLFGSVAVNAHLDQAGAARVEYKTTFDGLAEIMSGQVLLEQQLGK